MPRLSILDKTKLGKDHYESISDVDARDKIFLEFVEFNKPRIVISEPDFYSWIYNTRVHDYSSEIRILESYLSELRRSLPVNTFIVGDISIGTTISYKKNGITKTNSTFADTYNKNRAEQFLEQLKEGGKNHKFEIYPYENWYSKRLKHLKSLMKDRNG